MWDWLPWVEEEKLTDEFGNEIEFLPVKGLKGVRLVKLETGKPNVEYLVEWEDEEEATWEPVQNIAEDILKAFEERWWTAARAADLPTLAEMLEGGKYVLANTLDKDRRSGLHFVSGRGSSECVKFLVEAGSDPNEQDKEGYTPLHIAAGYIHVKAVRALLDAGADPEIEDKEGRSVLALVENLRDRTPKSDPALFQRRLALDEVALVLEDALYEEVEPVAVLATRPAMMRKKDDKGKVIEGEWEVDPTEGPEYLVQWPDEMEESWVPERFLSADVIADFKEELEYADVQSLLDAREETLGRVEYLVRWADGEPESWEPRENLPADMVRMYERGASAEEQAAAEKPLAPTEEEAAGKEAARERERLERRAARLATSRVGAAQGGRRVRVGIGKSVRCRMQGQVMVAGYSRGVLASRAPGGLWLSGDEEGGEQEEEEEYTGEDTDDFDPLHHADEPKAEVEAALPAHEEAPGPAKEAKVPDTKAASEFADLGV